MKVLQTTRFRKDVKQQQKRGKEIRKLKAVIDLLVLEEELPPRYRDHSLRGNWKGWRDCHIEPDWLLIYKKSATELILGRTGCHSDLF